MTLYFIFNVLMATIFFMAPVALLAFRQETWMPTYLRVPERWGLQAVLLFVLMIFFCVAGVFMIANLVAVEVH